MSASDLEKEGKGLLTTGATKKKKNKKKVTWKEETELKEIFFFELDEDERGRCLHYNRTPDKTLWFYKKYELGHRISNPLRLHVHPAKNEIRPRG